MKKIDQAFVLAAGLGKRMRPLTDDCPKPLLEINGRSMLDRALDDLKSYGIENINVNTHYLANMVEEHLNKRSDLNINISYEEEILETAGAVKKELHSLKKEPMFILNPDIICTSTNKSYLERLEDLWDSDKMDILLLLYPTDKLLVEKKGDYILNDDGKIVYRDNTDKNPTYIFAGLRIIHPRIFEYMDETYLSFKDLFDRAEERGRLYGLVHDGEWFHVGTPEELEETDKLFRKRMVA